MSLVGVSMASEWQQLNNGGMYRDREESKREGQ